MNNLKFLILLLLLTIPVVVTAQKLKPEEVIAKQEARDFRDVGHAVRSNLVSGSILQAQDHAVSGARDTTSGHGGLGSWNGSERSLYLNGRKSAARMLKST